ncbi:MAG: hypothetical protein GF388_05880 [Candidatus Aegiribacteria sp.]|nr:hypothetical protein [Candidatus Aegiribacteria sp.]MBD3294710.1 hypothetical protein [Candidatus Fermentibacteria bacterium]
MLILIAASLSVSGDPVEFTYAGKLLSGGERIDVGSYAAPLFTDWDGDGLKDLICGQFDNGRIRFYRNVGSAENPEFGGFQYLLDDAAYLSVPYG